MLAMSVVGCASFPKNNVPKVTTVQPHHETVVAAYTFAALDRSGAPLPDLVRAAHEQCFVKEWESAGIKLYPRGVQSCPIIDAEVTYQLLTGNPALIALWGGCTGYTLFIFPMWAGKDQSARARITQHESEAAKLYQATGGEVFVMWLPMVLMFPFFPPFSQTEKIEGNLYRHLGQQVLNDLPRYKGEK